MTKLNVVMQEEPAVAVAAAAPTRAGSAGANHSRYKKFLSRLDLSSGGGGGKAGSWIESMKVSSPTHVKSAAARAVSSFASHDEQDYDGWMKLHPSALDDFEVLAAASKGKQIVMFLDYDGTLSPIVDDPDRAFMSDEMREAVREVARHFPTAIVSGRCTEKVTSFVELSELYYAGSHGMDIKGPNDGPQHLKAKAQNVLFQPARDFLPMIDEVYKRLVETTKCIPGSRVENNKFCLSVHFRCVDEKKWCLLAEKVRSTITDYPKLRLTHGRKVLEIRPSIKWDKGKALEFLLESLGYDGYNDVFPLYIGDDRTDEDAFKVLQDRGQGFGILVSTIAKETNASFSLREPAEVLKFLRRIVEWKQISMEEECRV
ncbi:hypothetical protein OPV22_027839 [Ensete ventricosum]|uniref:Trehalose 6-phosphate phosphatase n=1 Tax=Ensete ventricosum TaxID=4639 RepID=A0AAV8P3D9_ENSVE|nr:hypothetical protein OPV22_027839 [Ensete ventricosum]